MAGLIGTKPKVCNVYHTSSKNVIRLINPQPKIKRAEFENVELLKLSKEPLIRHQKLVSSNNQDNSILIWGDSFYHQELDYFNHVLTDAHIIISTQAELKDKPSKVSFEYNGNRVRLGTSSIFSKVGDNYYSYDKSLDYTKLGKQLNGWVDAKNIHISIDLSSVIGYPALNQLRDSAFYSTETLMNELNDIVSHNNLIRMDFGGITCMGISNSEFSFAHDVNSQLLEFAISKLKPPINSN